VIVTGIRDQYEADLADMQKMADSNDGVRYLLVCIDVFNRELFVSPLTSKHEVKVIEGFKSIFDQHGVPRRLRTDRGKEFTGAKVERYLKNERNIEHWTAHNDEMKANFAERVIRTLKTSLYGYMRKNKTKRYIDILQDSVDSYNNTVHSAIGMKPSDIDEKGSTESAVWWHQYRPRITYTKSRELQKKKYLFKKGDHARISHMAKTFERAYDEKWTTEIFLIADHFRVREIRKYRLKDLLGETIKGSFYEAELQKVKYDEKAIFEIEKILKRKGRGSERQVLVKWRGWPDKFNSWIADTAIKERQ
jgi:hypothetical protein